MHYGLPLDVDEYHRIAPDPVPDYAGFRDNSGRIHPEFYMFNAITGRLSCKEPSLHSFPNAHKSAVVAQDGYQFVDADYRQSEMRIAAVLAKDSKMLGILASGKDLHAEVMRSLLGRDPCPDERKIGKGINFGYLYGQTVQGLYKSLTDEGLRIDIGTIERLHAKYKAIFPELEAWRSNVSHKLISSLQLDCIACGVKTATGRVIHLAPAFDYYYKTKVVNYIIQGSGAEMMLYALSVLPGKLEGLDARIILSVHDEILLEVAEGDVDEAASRLTGAMTEAYKVVFRPDNADNLVDVHVGKTWQEAKEG